MLGYRKKFRLVIASGIPNASKILTDANVQLTLGLSHIKLLTGTLKDVEHP